MRGWMAKSWPAAARWVLGLAVLVGAAGCASGDEPYAVPERVCGVALDQAVVRAVLPAGEKVSGYGEPLTRRYGVCGLLVDGRPAVRIAFGTEEKLYSPVEAAPTKFSNGEEISLEFPGRGALDDDYVMILAECGLPERPHIIATMQVPPPGGAPAHAPRTNLERFAVDYMAGAKRELGCPS
ncbi:hypothetical protein WDH52_10845 [Streptomyces sp. TRM70308]|uniref:hypothetical protein n=1 Tax=Streptomyces sp. TRM70308 TaxID=3131932 RepID=UPI003D0230F9